MFENSTIGALDFAFFGASLGIAVFIGLYFANKNKTFADYARGGGNQNIWAVSASMAAGYCSALTLIGNPSELYMHGSSFTLTMGTTIVAWPISSFVFLPVFKRLDGISIFQYIEDRFSPWLRRFVSVLFIFQMTFYSAISLYLPSLPLHETLKIPQTLSVGLIGFICIVYCSFGGIKAVTWTNLYHTILLIVTMLTIIVAGTIQSGGLRRVLVDSYEEGRFSLGDDYFALNLTTRHTIWNTIIGYTLVRLFLHGTSQMQVQSALSLSTFRKSQASQLISAIFYFIIQIIASAIGLILYVNYEDCDPYLSGEIKRQDELLMHYINKNLSSIPVLQGMFIAAIFGSTLTTMSSFQSSTSAMVVEDFIKPCYLYLWHTKLDDRRSAKYGKLTAIMLGSVCVLLTFEMDKISGLQQATTTLYGVIGIPILSAFALGTLTQFVNTKGMFSGMLLAISFGLYVFYGHVVDRPPLEPSLPISTMNCSSNLYDLPLTTTSPSSLLLSSFNMNNSTTSAPSGLFKMINGKRIIVGTSENMDDDLLALNNLEAREDNGTRIEPIINSSGFGFGSSDNNNDNDDDQDDDWFDFDIAQMSYLWLPAFTMFISVAVATLVSLLTGGREQLIDPKYLAPRILGGKKKRGTSSGKLGSALARAADVKKFMVVNSGTKSKHHQVAATAAAAAATLSSRKDFGCEKCCTCKCVDGDGGLRSDSMMSSRRQQEAKSVYKITSTFDRAKSTTLSLNTVTVPINYHANDHHDDSEVISK